MVKELKLEFVKPEIKIETKVDREKYWKELFKSLCENSIGGEFREFSNINVCIVPNKGILARKGPLVIGIKNESQENLLRVGYGGLFEVEEFEDAMWETNKVVRSKTIKTRAEWDRFF